MSLSLSCESHPVSLLVGERKSIAVKNGNKAVDEHAKSVADASDTPPQIGSSDQVANDISISAGDYGRERVVVVVAVVVVVVVVLVVVVLVIVVVVVVAQGFQPRPRGLETM